MLCDFRGLRYSLTLSFNHPKPFTPREDAPHWMIYNNAHNPVGQASAIIREKWNKGDLPTDVGEHKNVNFLGLQPHMDNGHGEILTVSLAADILVTRRLYFGYMPISQVSGFKDAFTGVVIIRGLKAGPVFFEEIERTWTQIESAASLGVKPILTLQACDRYKA